MYRAPLIGSFSAFIFKVEGYAKMHKYTPPKPILLSTHIQSQNNYPNIQIGRKKKMKIKGKRCYGTRNVCYWIKTWTFFPFQLKIHLATCIQSLSVETESVLTMSSPVMACLTVRISQMKNCSTVVSGSYMMLVLTSERSLELFS